MDVKIFIEAITSCPISWMNDFVSQKIGGQAYDRI